VRFTPIVLSVWRAGPFALHSFNLDLPLEVDDEYWLNDEVEEREAQLKDRVMQTFRQPAGKPSLVTGFNLWLKLTRIFGVVLHTLVRILRSNY
jgi:hypothetical protein